MIRRKTVDNSIEDKIATGLVVSTKFCREIQSSYKPDYFVMPYASIVAKWCMNYYSQYKKAPESHIKDIFELEKGKLKEGESELVSNFLSKISKEYEAQSNFNADYLIDKTIPYFKKRSLKLTSNKVDSLIELDRIDDAEHEIGKYSKVYQETSSWFNPFDEFEVKNYFHDRNAGVNKLFQFPGALGEMVGPFQRDWLVGILAPPKRGKSFMLLEMAAQAIMERLKVVFISLEMSKYEVKERIYKRITALGDEKGDYSYPCFDCRKNQDNSCTKSIRTNTVRLLDSNGNKPKFDHRSKYRPCSLCRGSKDFILASWFTSLSRDKMKFTNSNKIIKAMNTMYGNNFRALAYPEYSANVSKFKFDLDRLEEYEGFVPDVIIPDYADIFAPEDSRVTGRDRIDETWKALKNMAGTRHCLVATASQSNRLSMNKENVTVVDAAEDIRKVAHCNLFLALNQKEDEKKDGILRVAKIVARSSNFNPYKSCTVLQNVELGQTILDSEIGVIHKEPLNAIDDKTKKK